MNFHRIPGILVLSALAILSCERQERSRTDAAAAGAGVVYGEDSRREVRAKDDLSLAVRKAVDATAAMFLPGRLRSIEGGYRVAAGTLGRMLGLCEGVPFADQLSASFCSAVLVAADRVLTAAHCLPPGVTTCTGQKFVFGWTLESGNLVKTDDVYDCAKVLRLETDDGSAGRPDLALIELDRPVAGRSPVPVSFESLKVGDEVFGSAYPGGTPLKMFDGVVFKAAEETPYARAEIDTFSGGSGGPIFSRDGSLRALLIGGESDYQDSDGPGSCRVLHVCKNLQECEGEYLLQLKPEFLEPRPPTPPPPPAPLNPDLTDSILNHR